MHGFPAWAFATGLGQTVGGVLESTQEAVSGSISITYLPQPGEHSASEDATFRKALLVGVVICAALAQPSFSKTGIPSGRLLAWVATFFF